MSCVYLRQFHLLALGLDVLDALFVHMTPGRDVMIRIAVLTVIEFLPHHVVQAAAAEIQNLLERFPEVPIQRRVDYRIE